MSNRMVVQVVYADKKSRRSELLASESSRRFRKTKSPGDETHIASLSTNSSLESIFELTSSITID